MWLVGRHGIIYHLHASLGFCTRSLALLVHEFRIYVGFFLNVRIGCFPALFLIKVPGKGWGMGCFF